MRGVRRSRLPENARPKLPLAEKKHNTWAGLKAAHMESAKSMVDKKRQKETSAVAEEHLGHPPQGKSLIEVRLVIPGDGMLPRGLENPARLDGIRRGYGVWITNVEPNILKICGESMPQLRQAVGAINDTIHDMRLAHERNNIRFMVQKPCMGTFSALIRFQVDSRPSMPVMRKEPRSRDLQMAIDAHAANMWSELISNLDFLTSCGTDLRMRVNFGQLSLLKKGPGKKLAFDDFAKALKMFSSREDARLGTWLANPSVASSVCRHLADPNTGICSKQVKTSYSLALKTGNQELLFDAFVMPHGETQLSAIGMCKSVSRLDCTVSAPDMKFDWNLNVDSFEVCDKMSPDIQDIINGITLVRPSTNNPVSLDMAVPRLVVTKLGDWTKKVSETQVKACVVIPIKDSPYVIEVNVTQKWKGLRPPREPEAGWGVEIYGVHWDEAVNQVSPGEHRKNWGAKMENIWIGTSSSAEAGFREFIQTVVEVQMALQHVDQAEI